MDSQFDHQFDSYVISLKRTPQRLEEFRARNSKCGIDFCHFEGIDHRDIDLVAAANEITAKGTTLKPGSIGAAMSHLALWRRCAGQTKHFVVLEDDAQAVTTSKRDCLRRWANSMSSISSSWDAIPTDRLN
jgi:GR25 family glycosyltransferase involved in LPS biosynthesis